MWDEARQAAASPPRKSSRPPTVSTKETNLDRPADDDPFGTPFDSSSLFDGSSSSSSFDNVVDSSPVDSSSGAFNKPFFSPDDYYDSPAGDSPGGDSLGIPLARHLGVGGHGPQIADRLALLAKLSSPAGTVPSTGTVPGILPSLFFGDLRAGDGAATAGTMELCHDRGVQAFSVRYVGGEGGEEAGKGAAAAADYEYEDVSVCGAMITVDRSSRK